MDGVKTRAEARSANKFDSPVASARHQEQKGRVAELGGGYLRLLMQRYNRGWAILRHIKIK